VQVSNSIRKNSLYQGIGLGKEGSHELFTILM